MNALFLQENDMRQMVLNVAKDKFDFFIELLQNLDFVNIIDENSGDGKEEIIENLRKGFGELKSIKEGKEKGRQVEEFLAEL